jgi:peptidoglycan/xylan/chitin deacetylase (PgdA/CDA1 family)
MSAQALPVLMYHHVTPNDGLVTVSPNTFRQQMAWLAWHGYRGITCRDLERFLDGEALPDKSVLITFDDGYLDNYVYAHPVLLEFGLHGVIFLVTGWIGESQPRRYEMPRMRYGSVGGGSDLPECPNHRDAKAMIAAGEADRAMLRWSEIEAMHAAGTFEFHSHTHTHTRWDKTIADAAARRAALAADLAESRAALARHTGESPHLCWPQGYFDADYRQVAREAGFRYLYTVNKGINTPATHAEEIGRVVVKDRVGGWFASRMFLYRQPLLGGLYVRLRGD